MKKIELSEHFTYKKLLLYSLPVIGHAIAILSFTMADGYFVSNLLGVNAFAAVEFVQPIFLVIFAMGFMFGSGSSAAIAAHKGKGEMDKAREIFSMMIAAMAIAGVILGILVLMTLPRILHYCGATEEIMPYCRAYAVLLFAFMPMHLFQSCFDSLWAITERVWLGFGISIISGLINVILDYVLIKYFNMGVSGAAFATSFAATVGAVLILRLFLKKDDGGLYFVKFSFDLKRFFEICFNGASEMVDTVSESITELVMNVQLIKLFGASGVAAMGILNYTIGVFIAVFYGFSTTTVAIVGYKHGQGDKAEVQGLLKKGAVITIISGIIANAACLLLAEPIACLYVGYDEGVKSLTANVLRINAFSCVFYGLSLFAASFFTGLEDGLASIIIAMFLSLIAPITAIFALPAIFGRDAIWFSTPVATFATVLLCMILIKTRYRSIRNSSWT